MREYLVYVTAHSEEEATRIITEVVEQHLAACANIIGASKAFSGGKVPFIPDSETVMILKTSNKDRFINFGSPGTSFLRCPAIAAIEIKKADFLNWISRETS